MQLAGAQALAYLGHRLYDLVILIDDISNMNERARRRRELITLTKCRLTRWSSVFVAIYGLWYWPEWARW